MSELSSRFSSYQQTAVRGLLLVPSILVSKPLSEVLKSLYDLGNAYTDDLPCPASLKSEIYTWYLKWTQEKETNGSESLPTTPMFTLPHASSQFRNIKELLFVICSLPVTSLSAERSFSGLKRIKTALRLTMGNERLTSLALLHLHRDINIELPEVINEFVRIIYILEE